MLIVKHSTLKCTYVQRAALRYLMNNPHLHTAELCHLSATGIRNTKHGNSVSLTLLATTNGTAKANININGISLIIVFAKNNYVGITTAIVPVAALSSKEDTVHLAGGYRASGLFSNYDCRMTLTTFAGRDAYTNGTNRVNETQWFVYGAL